MLQACFQQVPLEGIVLLHSFFAAGCDHHVLYAWMQAPATEKNQAGCAEFIEMP